MNKDPRIRAYVAKLREYSLLFQTFKLIQIGSEDNGRADALSRLVSAET